MRLSFVFLAVGMLQLSAKAVSQRLSFEFIQVELKEAIRQIEHQTEYLFLYNAGEIDDRSKIDLHMKNKTLTEVLDKMLENTSVEYFIRDRHIILKAKGQHPAQSVSVAQPANVVAGVITDENGEPMAGAAIQIQGSTRGVTTDRNGSFSISVKPEDVLEVSFVGYETQTVTVGERKVIAVQLQPKADELEEVTIVAFGKQKKESVIGSITTVSPADLKVPSSNLTTAFAGQMAGVIAYQRSGEPGADDADFFVRGITTFGGRREPLILIDNVELSKTDLARLQPDDIASFSIMKDATATALYGARGANGVILVTTKQGTEGPARISVRVENSLSAPTRKVELADPVTWMQLANEAVLTRNPMGADVYSQEKIDNTISGRDPLRYPANDWMDMLIRDVTTSQRYNMSISGGGAVARYYVAAALNHDNGIIKVDDRQNFNNNISNNSYSVRSNIELRLTKTTNLNVRVSGSFDDYSGPLAGGSDLFNSIVKSNAVEFPAYFPKTEETQDINHIFFGNKEGRYINPYAESLKGYKERNRSQLLAQLELNQKLDFITEGLSARGMMNISRLSQFAVSRFYTPFWYEISRYDYNTKKYALTNTNPTSGTDWLDYREDERAVNATFYAEAMANYNRAFGDHSVSGLLVGIVRSSLDAPAGTLQMSLPYHNLGLSGRFTYAFASRYFTEFNFGYNGSERFAKSQRWGFFPSAGAAWNIANEAFWGNLKETVNVLKLRYSYGLVGNDEIGSAYDRFYYLSEVDMNNGDRSYTFGRELTNDKNGIYISRDANPDITWEISRKQNYAMEIELWQSSLKLIAEYFREKRVNILMARSYIPSTMGLSYTLRSNAGEASGYGTDLSLEYQKIWNTDFWTSARANFTYAVGKYDVYDEPYYSEKWRLSSGKPISQQWGYIAERLFVDDAEAANAPRQEITSAAYGGGDIKYADVNGDGRITDADAVPIGLPTTPEIIYGFGFSTGYKGFDLSMFFQGLTNESFWIDANHTSPFVDETALLQAYADNYWSEANGNIYATWPRLSLTRNANNNVRNTWFMRDGTFLRLKSAELGYTLPERLTQKIRIKNLRIYLNGTNLFLWSKFKLWDVEMGGNGLGYPIQRVLNIGLNLTL